MFGQLNHRKDKLLHLNVMLHRYQTFSQKFVEDMHHNLLNEIIIRNAVHCCIALYAYMLRPEIEGCNQTKVLNNL